MYRATLRLMTVFVLGLPAFGFVPQPSPIPEPGTAVMIGLGMGAMYLAVRRRSRKK